MIKKEAEMMNENKQYEVTIKSPENEELHLKLHWDSSINDWVEKFKVILKWVTFHNTTINEHLFTDDDFAEKELQENEK
jgi:hypothetical protein